MEDIIKANPMVSQCTVIGENQPCISTLIELDFEVIKSFPLDVIIDKGKLKLVFIPLHW